MKKARLFPKEDPAIRKGYNEQNPGQPQGAFPSAADNQKPEKIKIKSNAAGKKAKENEQ